MRPKSSHAYYIENYLEPLGRESEELWTTREKLEV